MLLKLHTKLALGWALIPVNFDPIQEIGPKVGGGRSFVNGPFFMRLRYILFPGFSWLASIYDFGAATVATFAWTKLHAQIMS